MKDILLIYGHGGNDPGASANGLNERDFYRSTLDPYLQKWAKLSKRNVVFYSGNAYQTKYLNTIDPAKYEVLELHLDAASAAATGGHVIIHGDYQPDDQDKRLADLIKRIFGCRGGKCFDGRRDLQNPNIARARGINYRLIELCFVTNPNDVAKLKANLDRVAKGVVEAMTGETLVAPAKPAPVAPKADSFTDKAFAFMVDSKIMSAESLKDEMAQKIAIWLYTYHLKYGGK